MPGKRSLLEDDAEVEEEKLTVNRDYASRFQHNKEREDLHRLREKQRRGIIPMDDPDDKSSSEEEDEGEIEPETEVKILDVIKRIRSKDPAIYKGGPAFFEAEDEEGGDDKAAEGQLAGKPKKDKPMYLKDVIAKQAMAEAAEREAGDGSSDDGDAAEPKEPTYVQEQAALKQAFLEAADSVDEEDGEGGAGIGGGLVRRKGRAAPAEAEGDIGKLEDLAADVFGKDEENMEEGDRFLKNFILTKGWVDEDEEGVPGRRALPELESDEEDVEEAEAFEHNYSYRFEEDGSARIVTHAREVEGTIRKKDERRKKGREAKKARQQAAKEEADLDLKRLKNIKKKDLNKKMQKMQALAGKGATREEALLMELLEKDFDPEEYDKQMAAAFGDEYYKQGTGAAAEDEAAVLDPAIQKELAEMRYADSDEDGEGLAKVRERLGHGTGSAEWEMAELDQEERGSMEMDEDADGNEEEGEDVKEQRKEVLKALDEYYKLDYEQDIGGLKCRFNYRQVDAENYGLQPDEILTMKDQQLNEMVGMRMLAPYREDQWRHKKLRYKVLHEMGKVRQDRREQEAMRSRRKESKKKQRQEQKQEGKQEKEARPAKQEAEAPRLKAKKKTSTKKKSQASPNKPAAERTQEVKPPTSGDKALADRKASYSVPKLSKGPPSGGHDTKSSGKSKKRKANDAPPGPKAGLTKAQKKNARRAEIRETKKAKSD